MARTRVKICGVCRVEDAIAAARLGADAVGMVFHPPSPRYVPVETAARIIAALPAFVTPVGLFVDASAVAVAEVCRRLSLATVQLHGHETPDTVVAIARQTGATVLKAIRVDPKTLSAELETWRRAMSRPEMGALKGLVLETAAGSAPGGTGVANDWETVRRFQREGHFDRLPPIIAAGGLTPADVGEVVRDVRPWAVDVSSGVEAKRGEKSAALIESFIRAVHRADADDNE